MTQVAVHKFEIEPYDVVKIQLPVGATILHVGAQGDSRHTERAFLWAEVPLQSERLETREFRVIGTGDPFEIDYNSTTEALHFHGSIQFRHAQLVFHIYEVLRIAR